MRTMCFTWPAVGVWIRGAWNGHFIQSKEYLFGGRNLLESPPPNPANAPNPAERATLTKFQAPNFVVPEPEDKTLLLLAPYCAIPRDYLSDTPLLRAMGISVSQHGQLGAIPPPPFLSVSPLESMRSGGAIPPPEKGYLSDTCAIPYENKANGCDTPPCDTISKG